MIADRRQVFASFSDPAADKTFNVLRVPAGHQWTIEDAYAVLPADVAASTADYADISLLNGDTTGSGTPAISSTAGGTGGWTGGVPKQIAVTDGSGKLTAGQWLRVKVDETGAGLGSQIGVVVDYVDGIGEKANA